MAEKRNKPTEPTYSPDDLIKAGPEVFRVQPEIMAGALYEVQQPITIDQAKAKLKAFLERPIK